MDDNSKKWMIGKILEFMIIIDDCLRETTYANDRQIYMIDLVTAARWMIKIHRGESLINLYREILSDKTNKNFGDYWRQSPWGENEANALANLQEQIRNRFNITK